MADYDGAHYFVKDWMEPVVLKLIKQVNRLNDDGALIISGGDVLSTIFTGPQIFLTHDFDIKAALKTSKPANAENIAKLYAFADNFSKLAAKSLNERYRRTRKDLDRILASKHKVKITVEKGNYFVYDRPVEDWALFTVKYRLDDLTGESWNVDPIMDVFASTPETINMSVKGRYQTFVGGEPKLSGEHLEYFIPTQDINGVLYAGMGYMLWDTEEMIKISKQLEKERGKSKLQRYEEKRLAILDDLNHPESRLNCRFMQQYVKYCERELETCKVPAWNVRNQAEAQEKLESLGLINKTLAEALGEVYVCDYAKKMAAYLA